MTARRPTILLTGFGPFPGVPDNASSRLVTALVERAASHLPGHSIRGEVLPTEWRAAPRRLNDLLELVKPVASVHFGVSSRATGFVIEARGRNYAESHVDACGEMPAASCIADDAPEFLPSTLPAQLMVARLRRRGLPAVLSRDAGSYLCNALLYGALFAGRSSAHQLRSCFVHLPDSLAGPQGRPRRASRGGRLDWQGAVEGGLEILAIAAGAGVRQRIV